MHAAPFVRSSVTPLSGTRPVAHVSQYRISTVGTVPVGFEVNQVQGLKKQFLKPFVFHQFLCFFTIIFFNSNSETLLFADMVTCFQIL